MSSSEFEQVLYAILSTNKDTRKNAENYFYQNLEAQPENTLKLLLETYRTNNGSLKTGGDLSLISLVLLRYSLNKINMKLSYEFLLEFYNNLILLWTNEKNLNYCNKLSYILTELYNNSLISSSNSLDFNLFSVFIEKILLNFYQYYLSILSNTNSLLSNENKHEIELFLIKFFSFFDILSHYNTNQLIHYHFKNLYQYFISFLIPVTNQNISQISPQSGSFFYQIVQNNTKLKNIIYSTLLSCLISLNSGALSEEEATPSSSSNISSVTHNFSDYEFFLNLLLDHLHQLVQNNDEEDSIKTMERLITLVQEHPLYFKESFTKLVQLMLFICNLDQEDYDFSMKSMALEVLITITESCPALARKMNGFLENLSALLLNLYVNYSYNDEENDMKIRKNLKKNNQLVEVENDTFLLLNNKKYYNVINESKFSTKSYTEDTSSNNSSNSSSSTSSSSSSSSSNFSTIGLNSDEEEDYINYINESIERVTSSLGGKNFAPHLLNNIQKFSSLGSWKHRLASILSLLSLTEGDSEYMKQYITLISQFLLGLLKDKSLRVRYYSIETLGRVIFLYDTHANEFFQTFLNSLIDIIKNYNVYSYEYNKSINDLIADNYSCKCIRGHAISALINLFSILSTNLNLSNSSILTPEVYHSLVEGLIFTMNNNEDDLKGPCILSLGYLALIGKENFVKYYSGLMNEFFKLMNMNHANNIELKSKIIISIGLICEAVGFEVIKNDINNVMMFFFNIINEEEEKNKKIEINNSMSNEEEVINLQNNFSNDLIFDFILPSCTKIAKVLKENFIVYYNKIFEIIYKIIKEPLDFILEDVNTEDDGLLLNSSDKTTDKKLTSTVINLNNNVKKKVTCNTFLYQQKLLITKILYEFIEALDVSLSSYLISSIELLYELIQEKISSEIRSQAGLTLEKYFVCLIRLFNYNRNILVTSNSAPNLVMGSPYHPQFINSTSYNSIININSLEINNYNTYFNTILLEYVNIIHNEKLPETKIVLYDALYNLLEEILSTCRENEDGVRIISTMVINVDASIYDKLLGSILMDCADIMVKKNQLDELKKLKKTKNKATMELFDDEEIEEKINSEIEKEDDFLTVLINIVGILIKLNSTNKKGKNSFMAKFDTIIAPAFQSFLSLDQPINNQIIGVSLIDDMFEYGDEDAKKYLDSILPILIYNSNKKVSVKNYDNLKQCSLYGLCINFYHWQDYIKTFLLQNDSYTLLIELLCINISFVTNNKKKLSEDFLDDYEGVIENSIYCLGCLLLLPSYQEARNKFLTMDLSSLPSNYTPGNSISNYTINYNSFPSLFLLYLEYLPLKLDNFVCKNGSKMFVDFIEANSSDEYINNFKEPIGKVLLTYTTNPLLTHSNTLMRIQKLLQ